MTVPFNFSDLLSLRVDCPECPNSFVVKLRPAAVDNQRYECPFCCETFSAISLLVNQLSVERIGREILRIPFDFAD